MKIAIEEYLRADGSNPYKTWFDNLDAQAAAKVVTAKLRLAKDGDVLIILFGGGTKRGQQKDIDQAKALHAEYRIGRKLWPQ